MEYIITLQYLLGDCCFYNMWDVYLMVIWNGFALIGILALIDEWRDRRK